MSTARWSRDQFRLHSQKLGTIYGNAGALSNDIGGENEILEDLVMDSGESAVARPFLSCTRFSGLFSKNSALSNKDNVPIRKLLLQLPCQSAGRIRELNQPL